MSVCLFYLPLTFVINLILIKVISMSNQGEIFSYIKWRPPPSLWWNLFFGVQSNAVALFLIDLKLSLGYMIEFDYWICALIHVLWLYVLFLSFRKLSVISSNCNRMLTENMEWKTLRQKEMKSSNDCKVSELNTGLMCII